MRPIDLAIVADLGLFDDPSAIVRRVRRMVGEEGVAIVAAKSAEGRPRARAAGSRAFDYYDLFDLVAPEFDSVRMIAQLPFHGVALVELGDEDETPGRERRHAARRERPAARGVRRRREPARRAARAVRDRAASAVRAPRRRIGAPERDARPKRGRARSARRSRARSARPSPPEREAVARSARLARAERELRAERETSLGPTRPCAAERETLARPSARRCATERETLRARPPSAKPSCRVPRARGGRTRRAGPGQLRAELLASQLEDLRRRALRGRASRRDGVGPRRGASCPLDARRRAREHRSPVAGASSSSSRPRSKRCARRPRPGASRPRRSRRWRCAADRAERRVDRARAGGREGRRHAVEGARRARAGAPRAGAGRARRSRPSSRGASRWCAISSATLEDLEAGRALERHPTLRGRRRRAALAAAASPIASPRARRRERSPARAARRARARPGPARRRGAGQRLADRGARAAPRPGNSSKASNPRRRPVRVPTGASPQALDELDALRTALSQEHEARARAESGEELARARAEIERQAVLMEQLVRELGSRAPSDSDRGTSALGQCPRRLKRGFALTPRGRGLICVAPSALMRARVGPLGRQP